MWALGGRRLSPVSPMEEGDRENLANQRVAGFQASELKRKLAALRKTQVKPGFL